MVFCNNRDGPILTFPHLKSVIFMDAISEAAYEKPFKCICLR